jgi:hypothetical protein
MNRSLLKNLFSLGKKPVYALLIGALFFLMNAAVAQTPVSGKVKGEDSSPLPGVNILVKGTAEGTISDADGNFSIVAPTSESILVFSFVGYQAQEIAIAGRTSFDITLASDAQQLSEVVVTALGIERETRARVPEPPLRQADGQYGAWR